MIPVAKKCAATSAIAMLFCAVFILVALGQTGKSTSSTAKPAAKASPKTAAKPTPKPTTKPRAQTATKPRPKPQPTKPETDPAAAKKRFDEAIAISDPTEKAAALIKFVAEFPDSELRPRALESLAVARAAIAEQNLNAGNREMAFRLLELAIDEAPKPFGEKLFNEVISQIPGGLFFRGEREAASQFAAKIEQNVAGEPKRLLAIAEFYLSVESGGEAARLAGKALELDSNNAAAYVTLGRAYRIAFELEKAESAYLKAAELAPDDRSARRGLADISRALGKSAEAGEIYRSLIAADETDDASRTGLILSLFESGKTAEAENLLKSSLESESAGIFLLGGVAHYFATKGDGERAVDLARRALAKDPRYVWAQIALARGLVLTGKPVEAEQVLVGAQRIGRFPTLGYELAAARLSSAFFREAADELAAHFDLAEGKLQTRLSGRIPRTADNFAELIAAETRAAIFSPLPLVDADDARLLTLLLEIKKLSESPDASPETLAETARRFAAGTDKMAPHRALFAARILIDRGIGYDAARELAEAASARIEEALAVANPAAAVMASQLYEARETAFARNEFLLIPDVPKPTLSAIFRGQIEETIGLALLGTGKAGDAATRFRRALTVYPKDSAWWRSAMWNLGSALEASNEEAEALRTYISSYKIDKPNPSRYLTIARLYKKLNGNIDGLEAEIGPSPLDSIPTAAQLPENQNATGGQAADEPKPAATSADSNSASDTGNANPAPQSPKATPETSKADADADSTAATRNDVAGRPRIVPGKAVTEADLPAQCNLSVSQSAVSLLNNGGNIALLVDFDRDLEPGTIKAISDSPQDVRVEAEPEIAGVRGRALFVVRSVSERTGVFIVRFESPCGTVDVKVTVR